MLVRAVDARKERLRRREQEALEKELQLAVQPLQAAAPPSAAPKPVETNEKAKAGLSTASDDRLLTGDALPSPSKPGSPAVASERALSDDSAVWSSIRRLL